MPEIPAAKERDKQKNKFLLGKKVTSVKFENNNLKIKIAINHVKESKLASDLIKT